MTAGFLKCPHSRERVVKRALQLLLYRLGDRELNRYRCQIQIKPVLFVEQKEVVFTLGNVPEHIEVFAHLAKPVNAFYIIMQVIAYIFDKLGSQVLKAIGTP